MTFDDVLVQVIALLQRQGRVSYGVLKRRFGLDEVYLDDLKTELIDAQRVAVDEDGRILVWVGAAGATPALLPPSQALPSASQDDEPLPVNSRASALPAAEAERRQLTVMFCDLVGSTILAGQMDPEDLHEVVQAYQATCAEVIQRFDGYIAQYLGDGLLVYFGYPQAHEDDAQRAVRTGLGIVEALKMLNRQLEQKKAIHLAVRVGIHTGLVVVGTIGSGGRQERLALGETPNIAARIQNLTAPDTVVISEATLHLVQGYFTCYALGPQSFRGVPTAVHVHQVLRESEMQSRLDAATTRGLTPLVGREAEVALLRKRWAQVQDGQGHCVLLSGEAGIGKSRLVQVVKDHIADTPHIRLECRCSPYYKNTALYPLIDLVERVLHFQRDEPPNAKLEKLERALSQYRLTLHETVPLFAALLSLPLPDVRYAPLPLTSERQKQKTLEALLAIVLELAERHPVLFILEDVHWVDPSTLEFLNLLLTQGPTAAILTVVIYRPEFQPPWGLRTHLTPLALQRLPPAQVEAMATQVTGGKLLPTEVLQHVVTNTDGVPLFVEELTKTIVESGVLRETDGHYELTGSLPTLAIPTTLHDALMARLDRLGAVKAVAQLGATIGRTFAYDLLQAVTPLDEAMLQHSLRQLVAVELLYQRGVPPRATYRFKHALLQETAYQSLLKSTRQQYHQRIAQGLAVQFTKIAETQPELVAHHYTEAGLTVQAIGYWQRAGQQAIKRSANPEAISHLTKGLEVLQTLPETPERLQQELTFHIALGTPLMATKGYGAAEVEQCYTRAWELSRQIGESPQLFTVLWGLHRFYLLRAEYQRARELGGQLLSLAQRVQDPALLLEAHRVLWETLLWFGEFPLTRAHLEQGMALYDAQQHHSHALLYGRDPGVDCYSYTAWVLGFLGYPDQALKRNTEALTLARELSHPFSLVFALIFAALLYNLRREGWSTQEQAEAALTLATEQGFPHQLALGTILRGWALAEQGEEGIAQIRQGIAAWRATGAELARPYFLALLAEACEKGRQAEEGLSVLTEALALVHKTGECFYEAELYRLQGELLLVQSICQTTEAETCFREALDIARRQQAKSLELRAAVSLSRLWQRQGKRDEARMLLAPIYGWFTEGFDTADLQEAKALLEELV
jgi:class 3 adenylate cyclase/predicted ATPase